jgi:hypothetical protein
MTLLGPVPLPPKCPRVIRYTYTKGSMPNAVTEFMKLYLADQRNITKPLTF